MDKLQSKLNRIEGQVQGIRRMYEQERDCLEIVQQVVAVRSVLAGVGRDLLRTEASRCARSPRKQKNFDRILRSLIELG